MLSDVRMPRISGIELMAKFKDLEPAEVNVIFITAFNVDYVKYELEKYDYKAAEIFEKPLLMKDLIKKIKKLLISA